jgi:hypothetical protein
MRHISRRHAFSYFHFRSAKRPSAAAAAIAADKRVNGATLPDAIPTISLIIFDAFMPLIALARQRAADYVLITLPR